MDYSELTGLDDLDDVLDGDDTELGSFLGKIVKGVKSVGKLALPIVKMVPGIGNAVSAAEMGVNIASGVAGKLKKGGAPAAKLSMAATPAVVQAAIKARKDTTQNAPARAVVIAAPKAQTQSAAPTRLAVTPQAAVVVKAAPLDIGRIVSAFSGQVTPQLSTIAGILQSMNRQQQAQAEHNKRAKDAAFKQQVLSRLATIQLKG